LASGTNNQLTKQIGEHLACAELGRNKFISTPFAGNVPEFDILAAKQGKIIQVQVKSSRGISWPLSVQDFLDIEFKDDAQIIKGEKSIPNPSLIYVFVIVKDTGQDEFFICQVKDVQRIINKVYVPWLSRHQGRRPKNPKSTRCDVKLEELERYRDNWPLLDKV